MIYARTLAVVLALAAAAPASAMTVADLANGRMYLRAPAELDLGTELMSGQPTRIDRVAAERAPAAVRAFFDANALASLGAFALAGGALATLIALGSRRRRGDDRDVEQEPAWRASVFAAIQQDLTRYTDGLNRHVA